MFRKIKRYYRDPYYEIGYDLLWKHPDWMPDKWYLKTLWKRTFGYDLDLKHPKTFNEKLQWLKIYDRNPKYTIMVDKFRVKQWLSQKVGKQYVIPTLAVYESVDEIDLVKLPDQFVLKCNHDCGSVVICKDKTSFDLNAAKKKLDEALKNNYYWNMREWPYKNVKRCVFAEKYLKTEDNKEIIDYKMMSFNGKVKCSFTCTNRRSEGGLHVTFYDKEWNKMPFERVYPSEVNPIEKPKSYDQMIELAEIISEGIPFSRIDFYEIRGMPLLGEITFYPGAGFETFEPKEWDKRLGDWIELPIDDL